MKFKRDIPLVMISLTIILSLCCSGCSSARNTPVEAEGFYMGTVITEKVYGRNAQKAADEGMKRVEEIQNKMTIQTAGSEIDNLNQAAGNGQFVSLSSDSLFVLKTALKYSALSQGAFDVTVGPLDKAWGIYTNNPRILSQEEVVRLKKLVDYTDIEVNDADNTARLKRAGQVVDLGAIAKGYAGDEVINVFKKYGIKSAFVNLGGNVVTLGSKPDGTPWKIGIKDPRPAAEGDQIGVLQVDNKSVVTSGDYERYVIKNNVRYHHILDPRTGYPSKSGLISVTIVANISIDADALSTSVFILGLDKGMALIRSLQGVDAIMITEDKQIVITPGIKDNFTLTDEGGTYTYHEET